MSLWVHRPAQEGRLVEKTLVGCSTLLRQALFSEEIASARAVCFSGWMPQ